MRVAPPREFTATNEYDDEGSVSPIDWIRFNCHMTSGSAANSVAVGEALAKVPSPSLEGP